MSWTNPRIGVIGAGAIGGITAARIKQAGHDVEIACKYEDLARRRVCHRHTGFPPGTRSISPKNLKTFDAYLAYRC